MRYLVKSSSKCNPKQGRLNLHSICVAPTYSLCDHCLLSSIHACGVMRCRYIQGYVYIDAQYSSFSLVHCMHTNLQDFSFENICKSAGVCEYKNAKPAYCHYTTGGCKRFTKTNRQLKLYNQEVSVKINPRKICTLDIYSR